MSFSGKKNPGLKIGAMLRTSCAFGVAILAV
jgi:hypothetical protein